jgi:hypothetical protein
MIARRIIATAAGKPTRAAACSAVPGRLHSGAFEHQHGRALGGAGPVPDPARHRNSLAWAEFDRAILQVDEQPTLHHEEELVLFVVMVPMELALDHADADHAIVTRLSAWLNQASETESRIANASMRARLPYLMSLWMV